jgi:hypothetical protein
VGWSALVVCLKALFAPKFDQFFPLFEHWRLFVHTFFFSNRDGLKDAKITALPLSTLLDYSNDDVLEKTFEVSLFAEMFVEMLQWRFGQIIIKTLGIHLEVTKEANEKAATEKKAREDAAKVSAAATTATTLDESATPKSASANAGEPVKTEDKPTSLTQPNDDMVDEESVQNTTENVVKDCEEADEARGDASLDRGDHDNHHDEDLNENDNECQNIDQHDNSGVESEHGDEHEDHNGDANENQHTKEVEEENRMHDVDQPQDNDGDLQQSVASDIPSAIDSAVKVEDDNHDWDKSATNAPTELATQIASTNSSLNSSSGVGEKRSVDEVAVSAEEATSPAKKMRLDEARQKFHSQFYYYYYYYLFFMSFSSLFWLSQFRSFIHLFISTHCRLAKPLQPTGSLSLQPQNHRDHRFVSSQWRVN